MSQQIFKDLNATNFRSIRGHIHAPLDAKVVLIHGENGAGKTSLLSAIELALTGGVQSLDRADPDYRQQLLHRSATEGNVALKTLSDAGECIFRADLDAQGSHSVEALSEPLATFFRERVFLPQSLLGQLLQIYQDSGSDANSPLAKFVSKLLGLNRLDALEAGLKPLNDVRNVRKIVDGWQVAENDKARLDRLVADQTKARDAAAERLKAALSDLTVLCQQLGLAVAVSEDTLDAIATELNNTSDAEAFARLSDQRHRLGSIQREIDRALASAQADGAVATQQDSGIATRYAAWEAEHGARLAELRDTAAILLPELTPPSDPLNFAEDVLPPLRAEQLRLSSRTAQARADAQRYADAQAEREVAIQQRDTIDEEIARLPSTAGSLGSALAELTSFITDEICPVCERDFSEEHRGLLAEHVHARVRTLSASAERLLTLGRSRGEMQLQIEKLDREIASLAARQIDGEELADVDRKAVALENAITALVGMTDALREGSQLLVAEVASRRAVSDAQSRSSAIASARETLSDFAASIDATGLSEGESFEAGVNRLNMMLAGQVQQLEQRLTARRVGNDHIATIRAAIVRRDDANTTMAGDFAAWGRADAALSHAQRLRENGLAVRNAVDTVRSAIIRREFNDRLNRLWRDLFVRLAPNEPFVPAFRIPPAGTQQLQPKLFTEHRDGGDNGGTPGAMLSAGNLNTAALTLFIALHLAVPAELPWLILDDPVQSMDDVHIAHFAALLRTLSKEHGRQVMIAVHDRQLFEYLKLELSPAFPEDSLLTLELSRGPRRDSLCVSKRFAFKEETALLAAA